MFNLKKKPFYLNYIKENFGKISQREMARRLKIGSTTVNNLCKNCLRLKVKKPVANENFFKKWIPKMSYILGLIAADGNIHWNPNPSKSYWCLTITAAERDKEHLEKIRRIMGSTKKLLYSPYTKSYRLIINNKTLCIDLMRLGIKPRKSLTITFPKVPLKFLNHFIRGIIDGDGSIRYVDRERSPFFEIQICSGSKKFIQQLKRKINSIVKVNTKIAKTGRNLFLLRYTCQRALKLARWIYRDKNLYLDRKFQHYKLALIKNNKKL